MYQDAMWCVCPGAVTMVILMDQHVSSFIQTVSNIYTSVILKKKSGTFTEMKAKSGQKAQFYSDG